MKYQIYEILENILQNFQNAQETTAGLSIKDPLLSLPPSTKELSFLSLVAAGLKQPLILGLLFNQMFAMSFGTFREKSGVLSTTTINSNGPKEAHRLCTVCSAFTEICLCICYENSRRSPRVVHLPYSSFKSPGALKNDGNLSSHFTEIWIESR